MNTSASIAMTGLCSFALSIGGCSPSNFVDTTSGDTSTHSAFVRASGDHLVVGDAATPIVLRGINLTNAYWWETYEELMNSADHSDADFQRIADIGFNSIRSALSYRMFEDDTNPGVYIKGGFDWLDSQIELARAAGLYVILDMHIPQSGFQGMGEGLAIWTDTETRNRYIALWTEIARRYKDETVVAGYDLMNEPHPYDSAAEWQVLAQSTIDGIRTVDTNHLIVVEAVLNLRNNPGGADLPGDSQVLVADDNVMYDFHFYKPESFLSQMEGQLNGETYPDASALVLPPDLEYVTETPNQPNVDTGTTDWREYEGTLHKVTNAEILAGYVLLESNDNSGMVYFDDITVTEYDATGAFVGVIETPEWPGSKNWEHFNTGPAASFFMETSVGHDDLTSFSIANHAGTAAWFSLDNFPVTTGHSYQVSGWMKGESIPAGAEAQIRLGFLRSASGLSAMPRTRAYLEDELDRWLAFGATNVVPMQVGEFGMASGTVGAPGGDVWLADILDILNDRGACYCYWAYHADGGGIYTDLNVLPDPADADQTVVGVLMDALAFE